MRTITELRPETRPLVRPRGNPPLDVRRLEQSIEFLSRVVGR